METFNELEKLIADMKADVIKSYVKKNAAAGVRVRKSLQDVKILAQKIRKEVSENKKD